MNKTPSKEQEAPTAGEEKSTYEYSAAEQDVLKYTNEFRSENGLTVLILNDELSKVAKSHAEDMALNGFLEHASSDGTPFSERLAKNVTYNYLTAGENIACGYDTGKSVVDDWISSEGHRENILNERFTRIGVSCVEADDGTLYWVQDFSD